MKTLIILLGLAATAAAPELIGWNHLGMHCMDDDYSVFSILPPYNTVDCQLIDAAGRLVTDPSGLVLTYETVANPDRSIDTNSIDKTNFWQYSPVLFNAPLPPDYGLPVSCEMDCRACHSSGSGDAAKPAGDWERAVALAWRLRGKGLTVPWLDVLIAVIAIHDGVRLYALDAHFQEIAKHTGLLLYRPGYVGSFNDADDG